MSENNKKKYEVSFLARSENGAAIIVGHLKRFGAEIINEGEFKKMKLAYPISKEEQAHFGCITCLLDPESISNIHDAVRLDKDIMRILVVSPTSSKEKSGRSMGERPRETIRKTDRVREATQKDRDKSVLSNELLEEKLEEILQ